MPRRELQPCGTYGAWQRHRKADEEPCEPCKAAKRAYQAAYRRRVGRPEVLPPRVKAYKRARRRALARLAATYQIAFAALLDEELAKEKDYTS